MKNTAKIYGSAEGRQLILRAYEDILNRWPTEYQSIFVPTHLGDTHIIASGDPAAPPLILLHGSSSNATMWIGDICDYIRDYRVYAVDIPGEPGKSQPARPPLRGNDYVIWLQEVYEALEIPSARLVGISLGGWLALKFASQLPSLVDRLVLLCPAGVAPQKASFWMYALILAPFGRRGKEALMRLLSGKLELAEEAIQYSCLIAENFNPRMEMIPIFSDDELSAVDMPVLLIAGERDIMLNSRKTSERLLRCCSRVELELLPDAGHILVGFSNRILSFLRS